MFFHDYVIAHLDSKVSFGFLQNLPEMWKKGSETHAYQEAVTSVALASFAHRSSLDYLVVQARQRYGKALQLAHKVMSHGDEMRKDSTLATVLCLGFYETVSNEMPPWARNWSSHVDILEYLLQVRRLAPPEEACSRQLSCNAHIYLQMRNLSKRICPSKEAELIVSDTRQEMPIRLSGELVCETCHFLATADEMLCEPPTFSPQPSDRLVAHIQYGLGLDKRLEAWAEQAPGPFRSTRMEAPNCSSTGGLSTPPNTTVIHIYTTSSIACLWNLHRCTRIQLLQCLRDCQKRHYQFTSIQQHINTPANPCTMELDHGGKLADLFNEVCASVPYLLGEIDQQGNLQRLVMTKPLAATFCYGHCD